MIELLLPCGFDTLEYSWVKATIDICMLADYSVAKKRQHPYNPNLFFNPKREVRKENPKPEEEAFICMFYGRACHLDEFSSRRGRIEKRHFDYARNSYRNEFIDFLPCSYSRALSRYFHGPNHLSYGFGS
jgi:hypothetical protein